MILLEDYFIPTESHLYSLLHDSSLGKSIFQYDNNQSYIDNSNLAIIGFSNDFINDDYSVSNSIRQHLYSLESYYNNVKIIDLGNFRNGKTINDTHIGIRDVIIYLYEKNIIPIIIGGNQNGIYGIYLAFDKIQKFVNIASIESKIHIADNDEYKQSYLSKIIDSGSKYLFNYTNIGYQSYIQSQKSLEELSNYYFDYFRLGLVRSNIKEIEPILRDAELINFSFNTIKSSDARLSLFSSPNGFSGDEACQIAKYSGLSDKLLAYSLFDLIGNNTDNSQTYILAAQMIWYFIEGISQKQVEYPTTDNSNYKKFIVHINNEYNVVFFKSLKTDRWWFEIPYQKIKDRNLIVSCSYNDYLKACNHELPDKWWLTYQKIN
ncbi:MAG: hypothetical protein A2033_09995 [Bacteroidetes bacterium GWA2_31_9]|nr:MAG: hypothetical protein A2033_09995 [Bacteroidetes bacterium GWA2_31_9]